MAPYCRCNHVASPLASSRARATRSRVQGDFDALQAAHRFIRTPADDADDTSASRMAKRYYDKLYRCVLVVP